MSKQINISVNPFGEIKMDADGFTGTSCEEATTELQRVFNGKITDDNKKPEYYASGQDQQDYTKNRF